jgi:hypothetical protein
MKTETISPASTEVAYPTLGKLAYAVLFLGVLCAALTGISSLIAGKVPMSHWVLMAHVGSGPLFAIGLALFAITSAERSRLGRETGRSCVNKSLFWLLLVCGVIVILSAVIPMTPTFGTPGQHFLYLTHRYSTVIFTILFVLHAITLRRAK